jgi:predicted membrane-bound spermidine synthase
VKSENGLPFLFFFSGACALVYQVLWLRTLGWVFGVTVYAASAVWAMFMAGLALGSIGAGFAADRVRDPLRWFGVTEVLIGATALATPALLGRLQQVYVFVYPSLPHCGARFFESINYGVLSRPNVHLSGDDGRNYLMLTPRRYDVITADVIHPLFAGSGNLYSLEYFQLMRRILNPGGIVLQWVAGTEAEY